MTDPKSSPSRREFLKTTGLVAAASAVSQAAVPLVHAGESHLIQVALIGCGGRGTGAAANALATKSGPIKLVAMADVFDHKLKSSYDELHKEYCCCEELTVDEDKKFLGFDAYRKAMDCLKPGDVVILATPPAFRWVHFAYAIEKGLNVFMEKPVTVDGPTSRKMLALAEKSIQKNLKVGVGLMCRHCKARQELFDRIKGGQIGDIVALRAYRQTGPSGSMPAPSQARRHQRALVPDQDVPRLPLGQRRLLQRLPHPQHRRVLLDEGCLAGPGQGHGRPRTYRGDCIDQNFDTYSVEYTFDDGAKLFLEGRNIDGCDHGVRQLCPRHEGFGDHLHLVAHAGQVPHLQGPEDGQEEPGLGLSRSPSRTRTSSSGISLSRRSARTTRTTRSSAASRPAWSPRWAGWPPTPGRSSPLKRC